jgi:hypothetical protein
MDPAIFIIDLQDANKKLIKKKFSCVLLFEGAFTSFIKDKESKRSQIVHPGCLSRIPDPYFLSIPDLGSNNSIKKGG